MRKFFRWLRGVDIVGVAGSIPAAPTIKSKTYEQDRRQNRAERGRNRNTFCGDLWGGCSAAVLACILAAPAAAADDRPNIILIIADDLGYGDVGYLGSRDIRTPNIDALADQGVILHQGYVSASICSPSRAGIVTGKYQQRFGHENNIPPGTADPKYGLPLDQTTMGDVMKAAGYHTAAFGKWHLGGAPQYHPNRRGYDYFFGWQGSRHNYFSSGAGPALQLQRNGTPVNLGKYMTDAIADDAVAYMGRTPGPLFMHVAFNAPHSPLQAPANYLAEYPNLAGDRKTYAAMVWGLDKGVGRIVAKADSLDRPSVIVFVSDNGAVPKWGGSNVPLRGNKGSTWDGGIRVPFVIRLPGGSPLVYQHPVISLDLLPTFAAIAGGNPPADVDGVNLLPYLRGDQAGDPHDALFWRMNGDRANAARQADLKTVEDGQGNRTWWNMRDPFEHAKGTPSAALLDAYHRWEGGLRPPLWDDGGE